MTPLTYGINHAGLSCEGLLCRRVVEHVEGDNTIPSRPDIKDVSQLGGLLKQEKRNIMVECTSYLMTESARTFFLPCVRHSLASLRCCRDRAFFPFPM